MEIFVDGIIYNLQSSGGISRIFNEILPRMCEIDDSLRVLLITDRHVLNNLPTHQHIEHKAIISASRLLRPERLWRAVMPQARQLIRKLQIGTARGSIWHTTYYTNPKEKSVPMVVSVYDMIFERFPDLFRSAATKHFNENKRKCIMAADAVLCISEATRQDVIQFYGLNPSRAKVIHLAGGSAFRKITDTDLSAEIKNVKPYFLYVGSRAHYKKFDLLLEVFSSYRGKNIKLVVVGPPWNLSESSKIQKFGLQDRVVLMADADDAKLCQLYNGAAAFVYPSLYEGFGIPLLEAMSCGCPVIASRIPSSIEVAGDCPLYVEPGNIDDLLAAFDQILAEGADSKRVQSGFNQAALFSWDRTAKQTLEIYRSFS